VPQHWASGELRARGQGARLVEPGHKLPRRACPVGGVFGEALDQPRLLAPCLEVEEHGEQRGAGQDTNYQVVLMIFPLDTTCSSSPITIPTALITTNAAGNGNADQVFTPADADGLRGLTVGGMWFLMNGNTAE
jgi:hypothetical protein